MLEPQESRLAEPSGEIPGGLTGWIGEIGRRLGETFPAVVERQLLEYVQLLCEWNDKVNLTAILDDEGIAVKHLMDSLMLLPFLDENVRKSASGEAVRLIDVGSGAGFPGLPLKIARPGIQVVLLDALDKRVRFLDEVICQLDLQGITAVHGRAEDIARAAGFRESFTVAVARAVASLPVLCEYCLPFVQTGGLFLAMKGPADNENADAASRAIQMLGGEFCGMDSFVLPGTEIRRSIVKIRKVRPSPAAFPRRAGLPEKRPLI